jgi:hypothetical protein
MKEGEEMFPGLKVPSQCPFILLVKVGWGGGKAFGSALFSLLY